MVVEIFLTNKPLINTLEFADEITYQAGAVYEGRLVLHVHWVGFVEETCVDDTDPVLSLEHA
jgi:hypothetical protein